MGHMSLHGRPDLLVLAVSYVRDWSRVWCLWMLVWVLCIFLFIVVWLSIPVQLTAWKDSSLKWSYYESSRMLNPTHSLTHLHELIVTKLFATGSDWEREDTSTWQGCHWWSVGPCGSHWCCKEKFGLSRTVGSSLLWLHTLSWHLSRWAGENVRCCRSRWSVYHSASSSNAVVTREIKLFQPSSASVQNDFFQRVETCLKLFQEIIAAHEYFPTSSMLLK